VAVVTVLQPLAQYNVSVIAIKTTWTTTRFALALALVGGLALLASACGGSSGANVAQAGTSTVPTPAGASDDPNAYSKCMRRHGVTNFPDSDGSRIRLSPTIDQRSQAFQAAARACRGLAPTPDPPAQRAQQQAQLLAFARCMRSHGVPNFPDPTADGQLNLGRISHGRRVGVDSNTPQFRSAQHACQRLAPGGSGAPGSKAKP
jgi:hypothetical protein